MPLPTGIITASIASEENYRKDFGRYYERFMAKGINYTSGYLEGRKGRISNLFSIEHRAAEEAFNDLTSKVRFKGD